MSRIPCLLMLSAVFCFGFSCVIDLPNDGLLPSLRTPLDQANCQMAIVQEPGSENAVVAVVLTTRGGRSLQLESDQSISINGKPLGSAENDGNYALTVPAADQYEILVNEPTRGISRTVIDAPVGFAVTSPADGTLVPLANGLKIDWSHPDDRLKVDLQLSQLLLGTRRSANAELDSDTGTYTFEIGRLTKFGHGAPLTITIVKSREGILIDGFYDGQASVERGVSSEIEPAS